MLIIDASAALEYLVPQGAEIEKKVYKIKYPGIRYKELVPVDTTANPWVQSVVYYSSDVVGQAAWFNGKAQDVPNVEAIRNQGVTAVHMGSIGYRWNMEEIAIARMMNMNLSADKASGARLVAEKFIDQRAMFGDPEKGMQGLTNCPYVTVVPAATISGKTTWADKLAAAQPASVLADVNGLLTGIYTGSDTVEMADTLLLPISLFTLLGNTPFNAYSEKTILDYIRTTNVYTQETGQPLLIRGVRGLDTAGAGGTTRCVAYRKAEEVVKMHLPMPYRFLPVWQKGPLEFEVPGIFRFGGVDVRLPGAVRYYDGA